MKNKKLKSIYFLTILSLVFIAVTFSYYNNSYADDCSEDPLDYSCHCGSGYSWNGNECVADTCASGATPPDCSACPTDMHFDVDGNCIFDTCEPDQGEYPACYSCPPGQSGNPCVCDNGNDPSNDCVAVTYCCFDEGPPQALNHDASCPDAVGEEADISECEYCDSSSTHPSCVVYYCPNDTTEVECQNDNPNMNCQPDAELCEYFYCDDPEANNRDIGGGACFALHDYCTQDDANECEYDTVDFCDIVDHPNATNAEYQSDCDAENSPHTCSPNADVCDYCTGDNCVVVAYPYCGVSGFVNSDAQGALCSIEHSGPNDACVNNPDICVPFYCAAELGVEITCPSGFNFSGEFSYEYAYNNPPDSCTAPSNDQIIDIENYLEGRICGDGSGTTLPPDNIDWCTDIEGVQTDPEDCPIDVCPDAPGIQTTEDECGDVLDVCPNIIGIQTTVPSDRYLEEATGDCVLIDICPNLSGDQATVPAGYWFNTQGYCVNNGGGNTINGACGTATSAAQSSSANITGSSACGAGIFKNYVSYDPATNPDTYNWTCYGTGEGATNAPCTTTRLETIPPDCGNADDDNIVYDYDESIPTADLCDYGTSSLISSVVTDNTLGIGVFNWNCVEGTSASCTTGFDGCSSGKKWCNGACIPNSQTCAQITAVDLTDKLKTTNIVNRNEECFIYLKDSILDWDNDTLCFLKNLTLGTVVISNFQPYSGNNWNGNGGSEMYSQLISNDTIFELTCWQDSLDPGLGNVGNGVPDFGEAVDIAEGSCRLNLSSVEFN